LGFFSGGIYSRQREEENRFCPVFDQIMSLLAQSPSKEGNIDEEFSSFGPLRPCVFDFR
jgi:hypothetical protein